MNVKELIENYKTLLEPYPPYRPSTIKDDYTSDELLEYASFILDQADELLVEGRETEATLMLGFAQGLMFSEGSVTVKDLRRHIKNPSVILEEK